MSQEWRAGGLPWPLIGAVLALLFLPSCSPLTWLMSAPVVTPSELTRRLSSDDRPAIFDLREAADFIQGHVPTSQRVAYTDVGTATRLLPNDRDLVLVCYRANLAALAVPSVRGVGHEKVVVLDGGMERWVAQGGAVEAGSGVSLGALVPPKLAPPWFATVLSFAAGAVIKPVYMLMSFALILWLRQTKLRELKLLRTGLVLFLAGELACLVNYHFSDNRAPFQWIELLHELGMAVGSAYGFWGAYGIIESKLLGMNDLSRGCALLRLCGTCTRQPDLVCHPQRQLHHLTLLMLPLAAFPWTLELHVRDVWADLFGARVDYRWPILNQFVELRLFPALALLALLVAWLLLGKQRRLLEAGQRALFLGLGLLSFSALRGLLDAAFTRQPYWADTWEEITELLGIASVMLLLWVFRRRLELVRVQAREVASSAD